MKQLKIYSLRKVLPPFSPSVLKPSFDLRVGHFQSLRQRCSLRRREVFLLMESLLQLCYLEPGERGSWFLTLRWRSVLIRMPDPPRYRERCCNIEKQKLFDILHPFVNLAVRNVHIFILNIETGMLLFVSMHIYFIVISV